MTIPDIPRTEEDFDGEVGWMDQGWGKWFDFWLRVDLVGVVMEAGDEMRVCEVGTMGGLHV